jgi:hypothetical protein
MYLWGAMRIPPALLLLQFLVVNMAPGWVVADFLLERNRIERELCVQRMVPDDMRTCHGECQLKKRLDQNRDQERNLPEILRAFRILEMLPADRNSDNLLPASELSLRWKLLNEGVLEGYPHVPAPVPWC